MKITIELSSLEDLAKLEEWLSERPNTLVKTDIRKLGVSVRNENSLRMNGVHTIEDLAALSEVELLKMPNVGAKALREIKTELHNRGLGLKPHLTSGVLD